MSASDLTPHGQIIEDARGRMSQRKAAAAAGISEGWWRQVVTGHQKQGGLLIPVNPKRGTLIAMANAVGADVGKVLEAAGLAPLAQTELPSGDVVLAADGEDMAAIRAAVEAVESSGPASVQDVRDRLEAVIREAMRAQRMLDRLTSFR
jgi:hypothetical protein